MLYLVSVPGRSKRVQQNADSPEEACRIIFDNLTAELRNGAELEDCYAEECADPMSQFIRRHEDAL